MKIRHLASAVVATSAAAAIGFAPVALADATVQQSSGNAQIVATPGQVAQNAAGLQEPFGGDSTGLLFHHR